MFIESVSRTQARDDWNVWVSFVPTSQEIRKEIDELRELRESVEWVAKSPLPVVTAAGMHRNPFNVRLDLNR